MKVREIIVEAADDTTVNRIVDMLEKDCGPYLGLVNGIENALFKSPMYRGVGRFKWDQQPGFDEFIKRQPVNYDRRPLNTVLGLHNIADEWFEDHSGIRFRSQSVFCTGLDVTANRYARSAGETVIVCPIGNFDYCWSPFINDMTDAIDRYIIPGGTEDGEDDGDSWTEEDVVNATLNDGKYILNSKLLQGIQSHHEIMIHCPEVYIVNLKISYAMFGPNYANLV